MWEIGPGNKSLNQLVISPGGDIEKLPLTKEIIKYAKVLSEWEFYYAKPIKNWNFEFNFEQLDGDILYINAFRWKYALLKFEGGMFEIIIQTNDLKHLIEEDKLMASEILIDGILGEEKRMSLICGIEIIDQFEDQYINSQTDIKDLYNHFKNLV